MTGEPEVWGDGCECWVTPESMWFRYGSAVEPGSQVEWNPDCPKHPPTPVTGQWGVLEFMSEAQRVAYGVGGAFSEDQAALIPTAVEPQGRNGSLTPGGSGDPTSDRQKAAQIAAETKRARSHATGFRVGDQVITNTPRSPRFHQRTGTVATTNLGEVGVSFTINDTTDAWFRPDELSKP